MSLLDQAQLARFEGFADRVLVAAMQAAADVAAEAPSGDQRRDSLRKTLATNVLNDPEGYHVRFAWAVARNVAITFESTDSDIQFTVNSMWDGMAGV
ncbi:hypothetical protein ACXJJ3_08800 [Kribbella sp. WER1]